MSTQLFAASIADDVREGLSCAGQKTLPSSLFYDDLGSTLFEAITLLAEYGLTRADERLLQKHASDIAMAMQRNTLVAELGSGSGKKTRYVLEAMTPSAYFPIDVSRAALEACAAQLGSVSNVRPMEGNYLEGLERVAQRRRAGDPLLVLFLGSTIGNFDRRSSDEFLLAVRSHLRPGDALLVGADLIKSIDVMLAAYDDATGVTAAFNRNILTRINREMGADFNVRKFQHEARWNQAESRIEMHLISEIGQTVSIPAAELKLVFDAGETIRTESSHKYTLEGLDRLAVHAGFVVESRWTDREWPFAECLWRVPD